MLRRYSRRTRWLHSFVYLVTFILFATGGWLLFGQEGKPSVLARLSGIADTEIHVDSGWLLVALAVVAVTIGWRGTRAFWRETLHFSPGDAGWLGKWPAALFTGHFQRHDGHFDPGQRLANVAIVSLLVALIASGVTLVGVSGGPAFVWALRIHKWSTIALAPVLLGHIVIASGLFPGYRGVWRSIHWRGELSRETATRLWPAWTEKEVSAANDPGQRTD